MNNNKNYISYSMIEIPDNISSSFAPIKISGEIDNNILLLTPQDCDQILLLDHWNRISIHASKIKMFSMWAKFDAVAKIKTETRKYYGCFILNDINEYRLHWDWYKLVI
jgi:hypothetical protein